MVGIFKKGTLILICALLVGILGGCTKNDDKIKIGITQIVAHPALDGNRQGFIDALKDRGYVDGEKIKITYENASGDITVANLIADDFVAKKMDLIMAIATPSAQAVKNATEDNDIPVLFSAVTDPISAGLVKSLENKEGNMTGTIDMAPIDKQFALIKTLLPDAKKVGIVYNLGEINSEIQVNIAKDIAKKEGLTLNVKGVTTASELSDAVDILLNDVDVIYTPTDNLVASSISIVISKSIDKKIPVIGSEEAQVNSGALITEGIDYYNLGYQTGLMAADILEGKKPNAIPVESLKETKLSINMDTAKKLGIEIPDDLRERATLIESGN